MASYQIEWKPAAVKELRRLPRDVIRRVIQAVAALEQDPYPVGVRKLAGVESVYRIRVGDYRVVYSITDEILSIEILRVGHRKDIYR